MTTPTTPAPMTAEPDRSVGRIEDCAKEQLIEMVQRAGMRASEREEHIAWLEAERIALTARIAELEKDLRTVRKLAAEDSTALQERAIAAEAKLETARRDALEEAAKICDEKRDASITYDVAHAYSLAAVDIRALQQKDTAP